MPALYKIDSAGNLIWNTLKEPALNFSAFFYKAFIDAENIYAFGSTNNIYEASFFLAVFNKQNGSLRYMKNNIPLNALGIIQCKDEDSVIRIVYYSYQPNYSPFNITPIKVLRLRKSNGTFLPSQPFGLSDLVPLHIDNSDNVYYYNNSTDSLIKYNLNTGSTVWRNKTNLPGRFYTDDATMVRKEGNLVFLMGNSYARALNDETGQIVWNHSLPSRTGTSFYPYSFQILRDSVYMSWGHESSGSIKEYGRISKINKNTGEIYFNGTITDTGGVNHNADGYFTQPYISVDSSGDIYAHGYTYSQPNRKIKKLSGRNGQLLYELSVSSDVVPKINYNVYPEQYFNEHRQIYLFGNKPYFLFHNSVTNGVQYLESVQISYLKLHDTQPKVLQKITYENNYYQYASSVADIERHGQFTYVVKKQGLDSYLEKYAADLSLVWRTELSGGCPFFPFDMAIDSTGKICIIGGGVTCEPIGAEHDLSTQHTVERFFVVNPNGTIVYDAHTGNIATGAELLGGNSGFYLVTSDAVIVINGLGGYQTWPHPATNFWSAIVHTGSNKFFHLTNGTDSIYIFSGRTNVWGSNRPAHFLAFSKSTKAAVAHNLTNEFGGGYILSAKRTGSHPDHVFICGVNADGAAKLVKFDLRQRKALWYYQAPTIGDVFKVVEDNEGHVYAYMYTDSIRIAKFESIDGKLLWMYSEAPQRRSQCIDIDISPENKILVAAIEKQDQVNQSIYNAEYIRINTGSGKLAGREIFKGDAGNTFIQAVERSGGSAILTGGNINLNAEGGRNGFLTLDHSRESAPICILNADFNFSKDTVNPAMYRFVNRTSPDSGTSYKWYFGNGDSSILKEPFYTYTHAGTYSVTLVASNKSCIDSVIRNVQVMPGDICSISPAFTSMRDSMLNDVIYFFNNTNPAAIKYEWDFGDGSTDTAANPVHKYTASGNYSVCLTATQFANCSKQSCEMIVVELPNGRIRVTPNPVDQTVGIMLYAEGAYNFNIRIIDAQGNIVKLLNFQASQGMNYLSVPAYGLKQGIYFLIAESGGQKETIRFMKL